MDRRAEVEWAVALGRYYVEDLRQRGFEIAELERTQSQAEAQLRVGNVEDALAQADQVRSAARRCYAPVPPLRSQPLVGTPYPLLGVRRPDWPYAEPSAEGELLAHLPDARLPRYVPTHYPHEVLHSWLGMIAGAALGLPFENWSAERIATEHGAIRFYATQPPPTLNDDSSFQVVSLHALEEYGPELDSWQLGQEWLAHMPVGLTAEGVALANLKRGLRPPQTATEDNPFAEWVGAAMRAEIWGLLAPGRPDLACRYALRDAVISHQGNGIYGALFVAALVSQAFIQRDVSDLIRAALQFVPPRSRLAELVPRAFRWRSQCSTWQAALARYGQEYAAYATTPYSHAHVFPCLAAALIALLYGNGDFAQSLCIAAMCGGDTDFAPALVGAILGLWSGTEGIPERWRAPLGDEFDTMATGMERLRYEDFAGRICQQGLRLPVGATRLYPLLEEGKR